MKGLTKKLPIFELILVFCLLLGLMITVTGLQNKEVQFVTNAPIKAPISNVYGSNVSIISASISNESISHESISNESISNESASNTYKPKT